MWIWDQRTGALYHNNRFVSYGYSGHDVGKNNPDYEKIKRVGPIPKGDWKIGSPYNSKNTGPYSIPLYAVDKTPTNDTHDQTGRSAFRIHGDSAKNPGNASRGCIILKRTIRGQIINSGDKLLRVK